MAAADGAAHRLRAQHPGRLPHRHPGARRTPWLLDVLLEDPWWWLMKSTHMLGEHSPSAVA